MATTYVELTGDGNNNKAFSFPSYQSSDVKVEIDKVLKTATTHYNITSYTTTGGGTVVFTSGNVPTAGQAIRIYRDTDVDSAKATYTAGASVKAGDLNNNQTQLLYATQEEQNQPIQTGNIKDDAVTGAKIADDSIGSEHIEVLDANLQLADNAKIQVGTGNDLEIYHDGSNSWIKNGTGAFVTRADDIRLQNNDGSDAMLELTSNGSVAAYHDGSKKLETSATGVTVTGETKTTTLEIGGVDVTSTAAELNILDGVTATTSELNIIDGVTSTTSELNILDGVTSNTSELNKLDGVTASTTDLNIVASMTKQTTISDSDSSYPTSGAVVDYVAAQIAPLGGLEVIATEVAFPNTQPDSGVVISISDAGGVVFNGSGVSTTGRTVGGSTVTINGAPSSLYSETLVAGVGLMVSSTGSSQTYNYHKILGKEDDIKQLSDDINDFNARYRVNAGEPGSNNDEGDLVYDTNADKMKVYDSSTSAWKEVTSTGDFKYLFLCPAGGSGAPTINGSVATYDLRETSNSGSAAAVTSAAQLIVSIDGVIQKPNTGTSAPSEGFALVDGNTIIFGTNLPTGSEVFITQIGSAVTVPVPGDNTVTSAKIVDGTIVNGDISSSAAIACSKLADDSITEAKLDIHAAPSGTDKFLGYTSNGMEWAVPSYTTLSTEQVQDIVGGMFTGNTETNITATYQDADGTIDLVSTDTNTNVLSGGTITGDVTFDNQSNAGRDVRWDESVDSLEFDDNTKATFGADGDLQIYHDGSNSYIKDTGTGNITLQANQVNFVNAAGDETLMQVNEDSDVQLFHNNEAKIVTKANGAIVQDLSASGAYLDIKGSDGVNGKVHGTGGTTVGFLDDQNHWLIKGVKDGASYMYHDNATKFETTATGVTVTGDVKGTYPLGRRNHLINGSMRIAQRGTTNSSINEYGPCDRWRSYGGALTHTATQVASATAYDSGYALRFQRNNGASETNATGICNGLESKDSYCFAGKKVTLSFKAQCGANYSPTSSVLSSVISSGEGTDQNPVNMTNTDSSVQSNTLTTSVQTFTHVHTIPDDKTQITVRFEFTPTGTAGANDWFEVGDVQLEIGEATPFELRPIATELAECQRYYHRETAANNGFLSACGYACDGTFGIVHVDFPVTMRIAPTALEQTGTAGDYKLGRRTATTTCSSVPVFDVANTNHAQVLWYVSSGMNGGEGVFMRTTTTDVYLGWSAEL